MKFPTGTFHTELLRPEVSAGTMLRIPVVFIASAICFTLYATSARAKTGPSNFRVPFSFRTSIIPLIYMDILFLVLSMEQ